MLEKWTGKRLLKYVDDKKISGRLEARRVQFPLTLTSPDEIRITGKGGSVKTFPVRSKTGFESGITRGGAGVSARDIGLLKYAEDKKISSLAKAVSQREPDIQEQFLLPLATLDIANIPCKSDFVNRQTESVSGDTENDNRKINKIVFNKDESGNCLVPVGKADRRDSLSEEMNEAAGVGVAPTISALRRDPPPLLVCDHLRRLKRI